MIIKYIKNKKGNHKIILDRKSLKLYKKYNWHVQIDKHTNYLRRSKNKTVLHFHRVLLNAKKGEIIDHINGNGLDNRLCNLRKCTALENTRNAKPRQNKKYSKYKGVTFYKDRLKYAARIRIDKTLYFIGQFNSQIDAAKAYNKFAKKYFGKFAKLNEV